MLAFFLLFLFQLLVVAEVEGGEVGAELGKFLIFTPWLGNEFVELMDMLCVFLIDMLQSVDD